MGNLNLKGPTFLYKRVVKGGGGGGGGGVSKSPVPSPILAQIPDPSLILA